MSTRKVLVAEDEMAHFELVKMALNRLNINDVTHAEDGAIALKHIEDATPPFNLIISDLQMPNMSGDELLLKVRQDKYHCEVPFIMMSALDSLNAAISAKDKGATIFIYKPVSVENLTRKIRTALSIDFQVDN